jgi:hypothetical protein
MTAKRPRALKVTLLKWGNMANNLTAVRLAWPAIVSARIAICLARIFFALVSSFKWALPGSIRNELTT